MHSSFHIIGDRDSVLGFRLAGVTASPVASEAEAREAFRAAVAEKTCEILIVTDLVGQWLEEEITAHRLTARPPFLVHVGDVWGTDVKRRSLEALVHEAVGIRVEKEG